MCVQIQVYSLETGQSEMSVGNSAGDFSCVNLRDSPPHMLVCGNKDRRYGTAVCVTTPAGYTHTHTYRHYGVKICLTYFCLTSLNTTVVPVAPLGIPSRFKSDAITVYHNTIFLNTQLQLIRNIGTWRCKSQRTSREGIRCLQSCEKKSNFSHLHWHTLKNKASKLVMRERERERGPN